MEDSREQGKKHNPRDIQEEPDAHDSADGYRTPTLHDADVEEAEYREEDNEKTKPAR